MLRPVILGRAATLGYEKDEGFKDGSKTDRFFMEGRHFCEELKIQPHYCFKANSVEVGYIFKRSGGEVRQRNCGAVATIIAPVVVYFCVCWV